MHVPHEDEFEQFTVQRKRDLQRIARATRGEHQLADVIGEAWLMASMLHGDDGVVLDLANAVGQDKLISHLYQHLVRYTEQNVRRAVRLDHAPQGASNDDVHPLTYLLVSDEGRDPLHAMLEREAAVNLDTKLDEHGSLAAAYVHLLNRFGNHMASVAEHLLISTSYAYKRCKQAQQLTMRLLHIPVPVPNDKHPLGPWWRFRLYRVPVQLSFDFDEELPL